MQLYFSPLACSMATRIALYETGANAPVHSARPQQAAARWLGLHRDQSTRDGADLAHRRGRAAHRERRDPAIRRRAPAGRACAGERPRRARLHQWLSFIGTELHKAVFCPLLEPARLPEVKATR